MLLERDEELRTMAELMAQVDSSGGKVVLVRGEAGIGKSAFVRGFIDGAADKWHVLLGASDDLLTPQTFGPLWDVAREEPSLREHLVNGDRRAVMESLLDLLSRTLRPTVLVIEDTHWVDEATLDAIKYLGRRIGEANGLLILTYRDGAVDYEHPLRQVIGELPPQNLVRIRLEGLSAQAVGSLVNHTDLDLNDVLALTAGNPLLVTEILSSGVDTMPTSVQDSILARAAKLPRGARMVLDVVSVVPAACERALVDELLHPSHEDLSACSREGLLLVEGEAISFHHELSRRVVEWALSVEERRRLNQLVLAALGDEADLSRLVHHAREAGDIDSIIEFAPKAAREALDVESYREAVAHFHAVEPHLELVEPAERAKILGDWARSEAYLDNVEALEILTQAIEAHRTSGDEFALANALTFAIRVNEVNARPDKADASAAEALAILKPHPSSGEFAHATSQLAWLSMMRSDLESAVKLADRAITLSDAAGEELAAIYALNSKGTAMYIGGHPEGFEFLEEARRRAGLGGYAFEETRALVNMTSAVGVHREVERTEALALRALDTSVGYEIRALECHAHAQYAEVLQLKGDWAAAEDAANEAAMATNQYTMTYADMVLGTLLARQGRPEAQATLDRNWTRAEASRETQLLCPAAAAHAEYMWLNNEEDPEKLERFQSVLGDAQAGGKDPWRAGLLAFWLWKLDVLAEAPAGIAEPYRQIIEGKPEVAAATFEAKGISYEQALALMHGDQTARLRGLVIFESFGPTPVAARLRKSLSDEGVVVPRAKVGKIRARAGGLTDRQTEVLQLLDEGLSNVEIANQLFVSQRTAEHHVSAILTKLDASTRQEAVARAEAGDLLTRLHT